MADCICWPTVDAAGHAYSQWIGSYLHDCVYSVSERASVVLGLLSILFWLPALLPQMWSNYKLKSADALAPLFLLQWLVGDVANLLGCVWTQQLPTQTYTSIYFCASDAFVLGQLIWYSHFYPRRAAAAAAKLNGDAYSPIADGDETSHDSTLHQNGNANSDLNSISSSGSQHSSSGSLNNSSYHHDVHQQGVARASNSQKQRSRSLIALATSSTASLALCCLLLIALPLALLASQNDSAAMNSTQLFDSSTPPPDAPICNARPDLTSTQRVLGSLMAWISGSLYFFCRVPQAIQNWRRQSCEGLSVLMFLCSVLANCTYGLSILFRVPEIDAQFFASTFPYVVGSIGVIIFDFLILYQSHIYKQEAPQEDGTQSPAARLADKASKGSLSSLSPQPLLGASLG